MATINGNGQANFLNGTGNADLIRAKGGNDTVLGGDGDDSLLGNGGDDSIEGGSGNDTLKGGRGDDWLFGDEGDDLVQGNKGDDILVASDGNDTLNGGDDNDTVVFSGNRDEYTVTQINSTTVLVTDAEGNTARVVNVEAFQFADMTQSFAEVILPRDPNLSINSMALNTVVTQGDALEVDWEIASDGDIDAGPSQTQLVIATSANLADAVATFGDTSAASIATGSTAQFSGAFDTSGLAPGTYYVAAVADSADDLAESDEADNIQWVEFTVDPAPNLTANIAAISDSTLVQGETLEIDWTVFETEGVEAGASLGEVYISYTDDGSAIFDSIALEAIPGLSGNDQAGFVSYFDTSVLNAGTYWIAASADVAGEVTETDETDNLSNWVQITVEDAFEDYALNGVTFLPSSDLDLGGEPGMEGGTLDVTFDTANLGNVGPTEFVVQSWISTTPDYNADAIQLNEIGGPGFQTTFTVGYGETQSVNISYELNALLPVDEYYLISVIQPAYEIEGDMNPDNNVHYSTTTFTLVGGTTYGTSGDDLFTGTSYDEIFEGYEGNDTLTGDNLTDIFIGGDGIDTADYSANSIGVAVVDYSYPDGSGPAPLLVEAYDPNTYEPGDQGGLEGVERVIGTDFADVFQIVFGEVTYIEAGAGDDIVLGSFSDDTLDGGTGNDQIGGLEGDDLILTGDGFDFVFVDRDVDDGPSTGDGYDVVTDFDPMMDVLMVEYDSHLESYDPFADLTQTAEGALLSYASDASILLQGVDISDLNAYNLMLLEENVSVYY